MLAPAPAVNISARHPAINVLICGPPAPACCMIGADTRTVQSWSDEIAFSSGETAMTDEVMNAEFPQHADDNRRIWNANAQWWDERIGDGNEFQTELIEPATERLLHITPGDRILDAACGAGRFARRMAALGARVVAFDTSEQFIARARQRSTRDTGVDYRLLDGADVRALRSLGVFFAERDA